MSTGYFITMESVFIVSILMALTFIATSDSANPLKFPRSTVMENEALLDPRGHMLVRWTIVANGTGIEMEFIANCTGWMGNS